MSPAAPWLLFPDAIMTGVILGVQLLVYPAFQYYEKDNLLQWHKRYTRKISILVVPLMLAQLLGGLHWYFSHPGIASGVYAGLISLLWGITLLRFAPLHTKIGRGQADRILLQQLIRENWYRTFLWIAAFIWHLSFWQFSS
jgi:hypothetical protein